MENNEIKSVLSLQSLCFNKILFERRGLMNQNNISFEIQVDIEKKMTGNLYKVTLILRGDKKDEYLIEIALTGIFSFADGNTLTKEMEETLIQKNAVAIMMPYLRSEVSLLTAQPEVECVVLPPFNINNMMK